MGVVDPQVNKLKQVYSDEHQMSVAGEGRVESGEGRGGWEERGEGGRREGANVNFHVDRTCQAIAPIKWIKIHQ